MKWMIASDLHGSATCVKKLMEAFEREKADKLLLLGDLLYHGPRNSLPEEYDTKQVMAMLNEKKDIITSVRGNCDAEVDQMVLDFPVLADYALLNWDGILIFATHGHHYNRSCLPPIGMGDILLHGHTHIPENSVVMNETGATMRIMNPGSTSIPKGGSVNSYMTYENKVFEWKNLDNSEVYKREAF